MKGAWPAKWKELSYSSSFLTIPKLLLRLSRQSEWGQAGDSAQVGHRPPDLRGQGRPHRHPDLPSRNGLHSAQSDSVLVCCCSLTSSKTFLLHRPMVVKLDFFGFRLIFSSQPVPWTTQLLPPPPPPFKFLALSFSLFWRVISVKACWNVAFKTEIPSQFSINRFLVRPAWQIVNFCPAIDELLCLLRFVPIRW